MTTKPRRQPKPATDYPSWRLYQHPVDLFGGVVVTDDDLFDWVLAVSPRYATKRSYYGYVRSYDVAGKVARSMMNREFEAIKARARREPWHERLSLDVISTH